VTPSEHRGCVEQAGALLGDLARRDEPIGARTTYRVGGSAALFVEIEKDSDLDAVASAIASSGVDVLMLGSGSNLLVAEAGFPGLVIALGKSFDYVEIEADTVRVGGATPLPVLARRAAAAARPSLAWAVGVPGSVGGAVAMNAGGHGAEIARDLLSARTMDFETGSLADRDVASFAFSYRHAEVSPLELVIEATFRAPQGDASLATQSIEEVVRWRREHQPGGRNAGSVFKNPDGDSAGRIIDELGLKGLRVGGAEISAKHANFIQLDADGSSDDVNALIEMVMEIVAARTGVQLVPEVRRIGFSR
jgi:UDP-N-acetylmuramate dehydrogenase